MTLESVIIKHGKQPENLIHILLEYQNSKNDNCLTEEDVRTVSEEMGISEGHIYSVITFYSLLSVEKRGRYVIQICNDVPCHVNGSFDVVTQFENRLGISVGHTTSDGVFTLEYTSCLGCCDKSPAIRIGEQVYGNVTPEKVDEIISLYRRKYNECKE